MVNPRLAFRTLTRTPFVTLVTVLSLALGIGANAAIFSFFDQILLRRLPVTDTGELINLSAPGPKPGSQSCSQAGGCEDVFSYRMYRDLEEQQDVLAGLAAHRSFGANLAYKGNTSSSQGLLVSGSYFPTLGLRPAAGRLLTPDDDRNIGSHFVAVLAYSYWETQHGLNPAILNDVITINGQSMTVVGVAPKGFEGTTLGDRPRVFVPITMRGLMSPGFNNFENRRAYWVYVFGRLKPNGSLEQAAGRLNALYKPILNDVEAPLQQGMSAETMTRFKAKEIVVTEGQRGQSNIHVEATTPLMMLFAITGIVLVIACANIANLLLARGASRSMEMAVRLSLGAGRGQLLAQLLTEALLLALIGGIASLLVAKWTVGLINSFLPSDAAGIFDFRMDSTMLLFAGTLSLGTGIIFGLFPALHSTRPDLIAMIRANTGQSGARSTVRFRTTLVTVQMGLAMTLLVMASLFVKSLANVSREDLGIRAESMVTFGISPVLNGYSRPRSLALFQQLEEQLGALPGVSGVAASMVPVLSGSSWGNDVSVEGFQRTPDTDANSGYNQVGPGFFRTMGITLLAGREFAQHEVVGTPKVAIVNEAFAKKFNLGANPIGKRMATGGRIDQPLDIEIVGFVKDAKNSDVKDPVPPMFFRPYRQDSTLGFIQMYVRASTDEGMLLRTIPSVMKRADPNLPLEELKTMKAQIRENVFLDRMISTLSAAFAVLATLLAAIGLYGVLAFTVAQRTREIGVRMALGADAGRVRAMVLKQVGLMTVIGAVVGMAAAFGLSKIAGTLLFGLQGSDPLAMAAATVLLSLVALAAGGIPAMKAARIDPIQALRYE